MENGNKRIGSESGFPLSDKTGRLRDSLYRLKEEHLKLWDDTPDLFPVFRKRYSNEEQFRNEKEIGLLIESAFHHLENPFSEKTDSPESFIQRLTGLIGNNINEFYSEKIIRSSRMFLDKVRCFDPYLEVDNVYQALRNIWIMNSLQIYMGIPVDCTDSMFAYSLLYPYTDNLMDSRFQSKKRKMALSLSLKTRLEGPVQPGKGKLEQKIFRLIERIECEFSRNRFPEVFQSLLLIYNAQIKSLHRQQYSRSSGISAIMDVSFEKGGSSVLADGYLLSGNLSAQQQAACFGWGSFLQLSDDIQDVVMDKKNRHRTIFSRIAGKYPLDGLANKLLNYITRVMSKTMSDTGINEYMEFSLNNFYIMIIEAIGKNPELYSREYVDQIESYSPFSFEYLKRFRKTIIKRLKNKRRYIADLDTISAGFLTMTSRLHETRRAKG
jgi:hypothetical protein